MGVGIHNGAAPRTLGPQTPRAPVGGDHTNKYGIRVADSETTRIEAGEILVVSAITDTDAWWVARRAQAPDDSHALLIAFTTLLSPTEEDTRYGMRTEGTVVEKYTLYSQDTSSASLGDLVYLSADTPGAWTLADTGIPVGKVLRVGAEDGVVLLWPSYYFCCDAADGGVPDLSELGDVSITMPSEGEVLRWSSGAWTNASVLIADVDWIDPGGASGAVLTWNSGSSKWATSNTLPLTTVSAFSSWAAATGQYAKWNNGTGKFEPQTLTVPGALSDLSDVDTSGASTGDILSYDGANWVPGVVGLELDDIDDVNAPAPTNGQVLSWNSIGSAWIASSLGLSNLSDVAVGSPNEGDVLAWVSSTAKFTTRSWIAPAMTQAAQTVTTDTIVTGGYAALTKSLVTVDLTADKQEWQVVCTFRGVFVDPTDVITAVLYLNGGIQLVTITKYPAASAGQSQTCQFIYTISDTVLTALGPGSYEVQLYAHTDVDTFDLDSGSFVIMQVTPRLVQ